MERAGGQGRHAAFRCQAKVQCTVDHAPVDPQRQRTAKADVAHDFAPYRISEIEVRVDRNLVRGAIGP